MSKDKHLPKKIGDYIILDLLGRGGNGSVYNVKKNGQEYALKILKNIHSKKIFQRFCDEIKLLLSEKNNNGILPILDYNIGKNFEETWYIMPIAVPILDYQRGNGVNEIYKNILSLTETLIDLHKKGIFHRDIKPNNIYIYNKKCVLSDFGLVSFPRKSLVSQQPPPKVVA